MKEPLPMPETTTDIVSRTEETLLAAADGKPDRKSTRLNSSHYS